jgi:hypothetical protein
MDKSDSFMINDVNLYWLLTDDEIKDDQLEKIRTLLKTSEDARNRYFRMMNLEILLRGSKGFEEEYDLNPYAQETLWQMLSLEEKTAPSVNVPAVLKEPEWDDKPTEIKIVHPKVSKFSIFSLVLSSAALIFIIVYARLVPMTQGIEVATLTDSMNAQWADPALTPQNNSRLFTNQPFVLAKGIVAIKTDQGVMLTIEGPSEFEMMSGTDLQLNFGRVYARVTPEGTGFVINTPNTKVIDMGTEFGVKVDLNQSSEMHVLKGKVQLFSGNKNEAKSSLMVTENRAVRYDADNAKTIEIPVEKQNFVRSIDSKTKTVWRGQKSISLADMINGGNGLGTGQVGVGIDLTSGSPSKGQPGRRESDNKYHPVPSNIYIDGVFIPDGGVGPVQITSKGHTFLCPDTSGATTRDIVVFKGGAGIPELIKPVILNGRQMDQTSEPIVLLHSNAGITFDLMAIRQSLPEVELDCIQAWGGLTESEGGIVDFFVLIDGQVRFEKKSMKATDGTISLRIDLNTEDRFLTFVVSDAARQGRDISKEYENDYFYLVCPQLNLKNVSN